MRDLSSLLTSLEHQNLVPTVTAYNRIDGPGSTLDLREFQEAFWRMPNGPAPENEDKFAEWSSNLPRTVGITVSLGSVIKARPLDSDLIGIVSHDYGYRFVHVAGNVPFHPDLWLLKIADLFGISGVRFEISNLMPGITSSGLGGSSTAATGLAILANALAGAPFRKEQLVAIASLLEQDLGVSITGTQEQSNVAFGGVTDYVWFPWGVPGWDGAYGTSIRRTLLTERDYPELAARMKIFHTGVGRDSISVNQVWRQRLADDAGFGLHSLMIGLAFQFREGLRTKNWDEVTSSIGAYRETRVELCSEYMTRECREIQAQCQRFGAESFPMGAGGGGAVLVCGPDPRQLDKLGLLLSTVYRKIDFEVRPSGHQFSNLPSETELRSTER